MLYKRLIINGKEYLLAVSQAGSGAPAATDPGSPGILYMDTDTGDLYKCTGGEDGAWAWKKLSEGGSGYKLPIGGEQLGGVKNGGNVVINADGTMTAPEAGSIKITGTENSKIAPTGTILDNGTEIHLVSQEIRVNPGEQYLLTCSANFGNSLYAIYESNGAKKENLEAPATEEGRSEVDLPVTIPSDGAILRVAWNKQVTDTPYAVTKVGNAVAIPKVLDGVTVAVIGDSLVEKNNSARVNFVDILSAETGATITNLGVGGTGYMAGADESKAFYQRAAQIPEGTDRVLIYGSGNDRNMPLGNPTDTGTDTLCGCINATIDAVYERVPTAWVGIIAPAPWRYYPPSDGNNAMALMVQAQQRICARRGIPFLDLYHASGLRPWDDTFRELAFDAEGVHPNDTGHALIAPQIQAFLMGAVGGGAVAPVPDSSQNVELDTTLTQSGKAADAKAVGDKIAEITGISLVEPAEDDIPKVFFGGALQQTKDEKVVSFRYISKTQDISGYAEIKAQGNSSMSYPKKNQTVKLYKDAECTEKLKVDFKGWGKQNKHCYKANWIDLSHSRNVVSARLWGDIVKSRANYAELPELLRTSPNQGAVDGFPIKVYAAGVYQGRYTMNIPKDKWMANMDDELDNHCILCGEGYQSGCFREVSVAQWTDEIHDAMPVSIKSRWIEVINFVMNSKDDEFKANLDNYFDVPSLIDYHLFGLLSCGLDAYGKNQLFVTYDGQKWYASMYDMDSTWGLYWSGAPMLNFDYARESYQDMQNSEGNLLFMRLEKIFCEELHSRWVELKGGALSIENIINRFERFTDIASAELVKEDYASTTAEGKYSGIPSVNSNNIKQIRGFAVGRIPWCDAYIEALLPVVEIPCTDISLSASSMNFTEKASQTLTATLEPTNTTDKVIWESSNTAVAIVADGIVTPVGNGTAVITATAGSASAQCSVSVQYADIPCTGITMNTSSMVVANAETAYLYATVSPEDTTDPVIWDSDNKSVVVVENGEVRAIGIGTATVTARCGGYTAECTVTVNATSLFSDASWSFGGINTSGAETGGNYDVSTGFIDVSDYTDDILIIRLYGGSTGAADNRLFWYDENETQIGSYSNHFGQVVPSNAKYVRMAVANKPKLNYAEAYRLVRNEEANFFKVNEVYADSVNNTGGISADQYASHIKFSVTPGKTYALGEVWGLAYYGADGGFISYDNRSLKGGKYDLVTIPDGVAFMSVNAQNGSITSGSAYVAENENTEYLGKLVNNLS